MNVRIVLILAILSFSVVACGGPPGSVNLGAGSFVSCFPLPDGGSVVPCGSGSLDTGTDLCAMIDDGTATTSPTGSFCVNSGKVCTTATCNNGGKCTVDKSRIPAVVKCVKQL